MNARGFCRNSVAENQFKALIDVALPNGQVFWRQAVAAISGAEENPFDALRRFLQSSPGSGSVPAFGFGNHVGARCAGNLACAIDAPVVHDSHRARAQLFPKGYDVRDRGCFVERRDKNHGSMKEGAREFVARFRTTIATLPRMPGRDTSDFRSRSGRA